MFSSDLRAKTGANGIRRFATRALLAVGGAIAGTAVAWALTTSAANAAETVPSADAQQFDVVSKIVAKSDEKLPVVVPAATAVHKIDETLRAEQQKARAALPDVQVSAAVEQIAQRILPQVTRIGQSQAPAIERSMDVVFPEAPASTDAGQSPAPVVSQFTGPSGATWADLLEHNDFVVPSEQLPPLPSNPFPKLPVPAPAPVQCSSCNDGSGSAKGSTIAAFAASGNAHGISSTRALAPSVDEVTVTPGKQPGINPD